MKKAKTETSVRDLNRSELKDNSASQSSLSRRAFLSSAGGATAITVASSALCFSPSLGAKNDETAETRTLAGRRRFEQAYKIRNNAALYQKNVPAANHPINGDEKLYPNKICNFTKGLLHNSFGEVELVGYESLIKALTSGRPVDFERIPMGNIKKFANPQAAFAFVLEGPDSHQLGMIAPPAFSSAEQAGEMAELYWQALTRDVPFSEFDTNPLTNAAAADLSRCSDFLGAKLEGKVTIDTMFRGKAPGDLIGPYISQFLWKDILYGTMPIAQRIRTSMPGIDYMFTFARWLAVQNGEVTGSNHFDPVPRYIRSGRDLAEYVHRDFTYQAFLNACLILLDMGAPFDSSNPYRHSRTQSGFSTFGDPHILDLVARVANCGLKAAWYQKWLLHRRLRPEEFGGRVHMHRVGVRNYSIHSDILDSPALDAVFSKNGTCLLMQAYPEGCPLHPAYPAGHAVIAGACATVLKAFFEESFVIRNPVVASRDGQSLNPYTGPDLTVGGELNKLASNIAIGRNAAGVHWRSDSIEGLKLGEAVAIGILTDMKMCSSEDFRGFSLTKFDGTTITL